MAIVVQIDHEHRRVLARAEGRITLTDVRAHLEQERHGGGLPYAEMIDARGYQPAFSPSEVREIVVALRQAALHSQLGPTAIVVDSDVGYGVVRMVETLVEDVCAVRPFRRQEEAEEWLNRHPPQGRPEAER